MATKKEYRTTIIFSLKDKVGALLDALTPFKKHKINLTKITSIPHPKKWQYIFFIEIKGKRETPCVKKALAELKKHTVSLHLFGSYPLYKF